MRQSLPSVLACHAFASLPRFARSSRRHRRRRQLGRHGRSSFIIPLGPGSGVDITARVFADKLSAKWGQPVVVENRPGGDAFVAITAVIGAHDDHVLLFAPASTFTAHPLLHEKLPYDINDLVPIARVTNTLIALGVPTELGVGTVKELAAKINASPGKLNYASVTGANDLMFAAFLKTEKLDMAKVPYKDPVTAINDLSEGRIQAFVGAYAIMRPRVLAGKVKVIALTNLATCGRAAGYSDRQEKPATNRWSSTALSACWGRATCRKRRATVSPPIFATSPPSRMSWRGCSSTGQVINPGTPAEFKAALDDQRATVAAIGKVLDIKPAQ